MFLDVLHEVQQGFALDEAADEGVLLQGLLLAEHLLREVGLGQGGEGKGFLVVEGEEDLAESCEETLEEVGELFFPDEVLLHVAHHVEEGVQAFLEVDGTHADDEDGEELVGVEEAAGRGEEGEELVLQQDRQVETLELLGGREEEGHGLAVGVGEHVEEVDHTLLGPLGRQVLQAGRETLQGVQAEGQGQGRLC